MATDLDEEFQQLLIGLQSGHWRERLESSRGVVAWVRSADPGDPRREEMTRALVDLATHEKWEIRRAVAQAAAVLVHPSFEPILARLAADTNARVRQAAQMAALRRRDGRHASVFGKEHAERISTTLDAIQTRYGIPGREAVRRAAESIANTFARELYHEVIKLMSPLATAAERLQVELAKPAASSAMLMDEARRIRRQVTHLEAVLNAMRSYAAAPTLRFARESLRELVDEATHLVCGERAVGGVPVIAISVVSDYVCEVDRARMVQALTNLLANAVESYEGIEGEAKAIEVSAEVMPGAVRLRIQDFGTGMSPEVLRDAPTFFASKKRNGTGFGLPLAIRIIEAEHGGRLSIESSKGAGTSVWVVLPTQHEEGT